MPIVDGLTSTKMIRSHEKSNLKSILSPRAAINSRVPIFAVSASLLERERPTYINAGFDGWILKPIDFKRLNQLLLGIVDQNTRESCLYRPGEWERGGWFHKRSQHVVSSTKIPSLSLRQHPQLQNASPQPDIDSVHSSESGSITPTKLEASRPLVRDEKVDASRENDSPLDTGLGGTRVAENNTDQPAM
jgi:CheY-like chemotaxis protein